MLANEIAKYTENLATKERWLILNKKDLLTDEEFLKKQTELLNDLNWQGKIFAISAYTGDGVNELIQALAMPTYDNHGLSFRKYVHQLVAVYLQL